MDNTEANQQVQAQVNSANNAGSIQNVSPTRILNTFDENNPVINPVPNQPPPTTNQGQENAHNEGQPDPKTPTGQNDQKPRNEDEKDDE